jgi:undecaprenyl-diphosphatase
VPVYQLAVLAIVQGLTEFLPISSSGHLILVPRFTGWEDQGLVIDVATHVGTLVAVLLFFWRDSLAMLRGVYRMAAGRFDRGAKLFLLLLVGTVPALIVGYLVDKYVAGALRSPLVIAYALIGFGILLFLADRVGMTVFRLEHLTVGHVLLVGLAQAVAFIPGTSRSGITMSAARLIGYERTEAARLSFLLSVPAIAAAGLWKGYQLSRGSVDASLADAAIVCGFTVVAGLLAIAVLMVWLRRASFTPFVLYRLALGGVLLYLYSP